MDVQRARERVGFSMTGVTAARVGVGQVVLAVLLAGVLGSSPAAAGPPPPGPPVGAPPSLNAPPSAGAAVPTAPPPAGPGAPAPPPPGASVPPTSTTPPVTVAPQNQGVTVSRAVLKGRVLRVKLVCSRSGVLLVRRLHRTVARKAFACKDSAAQLKVRLSKRMARRVRSTGRVHVIVRSGAQVLRLTLSVNRGARAMSAAIIQDPPIEGTWDCWYDGHQDLDGLIHTNTSNVTETFYYSNWRYVYGYGYDWAWSGWQAVTVQPGGSVPMPSLHDFGWPSGYWYAVASWFYSSVTGNYSYAWRLTRQLDVNARLVRNSYWCGY
jgi:hypothetical protein